MNHFRCPNCGGESSVVDTRERTIAKETVLKRYRQCDTCKKRWATVEISRDHFVNLKGDADALADVGRAVRRIPRNNPAIRALIGTDPTIDRGEG